MPRRRGAIHPSAPPPPQEAAAPTPRKRRVTRRAKAAPKPAPTGGDFIVFGDLHVGTKTLDRCLRTLANIRAEAKARGCEVVCTGDFWDKRGSLAVRHLDALIEELSRWQADGVTLHLIPGNHDQVSLDGAIHSVRVFEPFPNVHVYTEAHIDADRRIAFVPWRELPEEQTRQFESIPDGGDFTIFAHAEVGGARANGGHTAAGKVSRKTIEAKARACYLGHYHKRQKLGSRTWYIGSPFEMNFGERGEPHGFGVVSLSEVDPTFIDQDDFPKHYRLKYGEPWPEGLKVDDLIEVVAPPSAIDRRGYMCVMRSSPR